MTAAQLFVLHPLAMTLATLASALLGIAIGRAAARLLLRIQAVRSWLDRCAARLADSLLRSMAAKEVYGTEGDLRRRGQHSSGPGARCSACRGSGRVTS